MFRNTRAVTAALIFATMIVAAPVAHAVPALQLYSPDAVYNADLQTWVLTEGTFELWVVGDVGRVGSIEDVFLSGSVYGTSGDVTVTLNGVELSDALEQDYTAAGGYDNVTHHAEYANADGHLFWSVGDLTSTADQIADYQPGADGTSTGTILKLMISISGYEAVHFDAFDHYFTGGGSPNGRNAGYRDHYNSVFAPFSHDATSGEAPEPGSIWMLGVGLAGLVATARRKRNR